MPKLWKIDTEMQRWCGRLEAEVATCTQVPSTPIFGIVSVYRGSYIFAAVPRTRAARTASSVLIKLPEVTDKRLKRSGGPGAGWITFELDSESDIAEALQWLKQAYEKAKRRQR